MENVNYKIIDTAGQKTAVVLYSKNPKSQSLRAKRIMAEDKSIEQVAFLQKDSNSKYYSLVMMGNELSINGTLAGIYLTSEMTKNPNVKLRTSGINEVVSGIATQRSVSVKLPKCIFIKKINNVFLLKGIVYEIRNKINNTNEFYLKNNLKTLAIKYKSYAAGIIYLENSRIVPCIYVVKTDSLVWENACGSGSLSATIFTGHKRILQPSGDFINILTGSKYFTIKTSAKIVK